jgi:hypothetical protein
MGDDASGDEPVGDADNVPRLPAPADAGKFFAEEASRWGRVPAIRPAVVVVTVGDFD